MSSLHVTILFSTVQKAIAHTHSKKSRDMPSSNTIHVTGHRSLRTLHCSKQYSTQVQTPRTLGYHDDDQTITGSSIRQAARPNRD
ncbi:hypothetical protein CDAR_450491 [Caerostris darwini]|uniref:Secreted protein n=1 Tax=Caerostris darwini TaxID=1538125 RepID=A0AAV4WR75_9ARAC|nr:hypothetical protein CDAR_450491 [Caerostris darwini]